MFAIGRSTVNQLIQRAKSMNDYNNHGVANDAVWIDHFNSALVEMVDDLNLEGVHEIAFTPEQKSYTLPDDYYSLILINDKSNNQRLTQKRHFDQQYPPGYWVRAEGDKYVIDISHNQPTTFEVYYEKYPEYLEVALKEAQKPDVPTVGETALCYKAISHALKNNNQLGQAQHFDDLFKEQLAVIRTASNRSRGQ